MQLHKHATIQYEILLLAKTASEFSVLDAVREESFLFTIAVETCVINEQGFRSKIAFAHFKRVKQAFAQTFLINSDCIVTADETYLKPNSK